ncbi:MAG: RNA-binding S4 domain-containing protein [Bacteroidales bacterium]|jgi:ribosome-associated heat shock protein Hsp15|nr:RNA-binding S4 domain-containing protein [Bacteroidales bacterium]MDD4208889.1 RNA-binding S4 domain-containing protein [Bacteroidales bacterium]MDY0015513.1 RNA-binding S4 domain-containing protein [Bacteroidales bacterium]
MLQKTRIDKWLWMVRLFKTRTLATEACNAGKIKISGMNCKSSREIKENDIVQVRIGQLIKTVQVLDTPKNRIAAKLAANYYTDLTTEEEYERLRLLRMNVEHREQGIGRPTKRDRRQLDYMKDFLSDTDEWKD